jgi:hypothetical protein
MPKIYISDKGDYEVLFPPFEAILDTNTEVDNNNREDFKIKLIEFLQQFFDLIKPIEITFDDECRQCGERLEKNEKNGIYRFEKCKCFQEKGGSKC